MLAGWLNIRKKLKLLFSAKTLTFRLFLKHGSLTKATAIFLGLYCYHITYGKVHRGTVLS